MSILVADDDEDVLIAIEMALVSFGYRVVTCRSPGEVLKLVHKASFELVILDLNYQMDITSGTEGLDLIDALREVDAAMPVVAMTGWGSIELVVEAMRRGASDFLEKPWDSNERLKVLVDKNIRVSELMRSERNLKVENRMLREATESSDVLSCKSASMKAFMEITERVAGSDIPILIIGENGTGKSMIARHIHTLSKRRDHSLISVNMGGLMETVFESEMFGHVKGAFTDAKEARVGKVELAAKGTLFLDEVAHTPLAQQVKLLHLLEERKFTKLGSSQEKISDARIISATNANILQKVQSGEFRQDLYYRLNGITIDVPSLRERREDILPLAHSFLRKATSGSGHKALSADTTQILLDYAWPGNVRELRHVIERAVILAGDTIYPDDLQLSGANLATKADVSKFMNSSLRDMEAALIRSALERYTNVEDAAKSLGISRSALYRRLEKSKKREIEN